VKQRGFPGQTDLEFSITTTKYSGMIV